MQAHAAFCRQLLDDFCGEITGRSIDTLEGIHPQDKFLVGMISPKAEAAESSTGSSSVIVGQLGVDFFLKERDIQDTTLSIRLIGDLFYRCVPTLEQQRKVFLQEPEIIELQTDNFEQICSKIDDVQAGKGIKQLAVYKKLKLEDIISYPLILRLSDIYNPETHSGKLPADSAINEEIKKRLTEKTNQLAEMPDAYRKNRERLHLSDVVSDLAWEKYQHRSTDGVNPVRQSWYFTLTCDIQRIRGGLVRVSIKINNESKYQPNDGSTHSAKRETERVNDLFNGGLTVKIEGSTPEPFELEYFKDDYKYDREQYAMGSGCGVTVSDDHTYIETTLLPIYEQKRLKTRPNSEVRFDDLINSPVKTLRFIHDGMMRYLKKWEDDLQSRKNSGNITKRGIEQFESEIGSYRIEIDRFANGINMLESYMLVRTAFTNMNMAFKQSSKKYSGWRLFQIVFIVSLIPDIVACDPELLDAVERQKTHLEDMDLLFFPTGGGKTEAFLGILVFNLFFDRMRGKEVGVTAMLKYPLRLLSVQQVQRVADILASAERIRRNNIEDMPGAPFAVGYFVGDNNTPNKIESEQKEKLVQMTQETMDEEYRVVDRCPFCGQMTVHVQYDEQTNRLVHKCVNPSCDSGNELPIYIVDTDVYRFLPSVIISTIDKMAAIGNQRRFKNLFGSVSQKCPLHGYHEYGLCEEKDCSEIQEDVRLYDAAPSLFIQDELHLVRESLGTYDAHYESMIHYMVSELSDSHRPAKIIGATATISSYENQVRNLYNKRAIRFPCATPYLGENYYAKEDANDLHRLILGYTPFGRAIINSVVYSMKAMRICINRYKEHPEMVLSIPGIDGISLDEAKRIIEDYWIMLQYNNVKVDGNNVLNALDDPINTELSQEGVPPFSSRKMTGDDTFQDVRRVLSEVENMTNAFENDFNLIVATSMISHGVDADRFNNMMFFGIPGNMAEYIQAYSRVGRKYPGIVIDIIRPTREREVSWQKYFIKFHEFKDILVDPVPINRWASRAVEQTLPGLFCALVLNHYMYKLRDKHEKLYMMDGLKKAIEEGWITRKEVIDQLCCVYGCADDAFHARGNQYKKAIIRIVDDIFDTIGTTVYDKRTYITSGLPYRVMNSLRDTDSGLSIELR